MKLILTIILLSATSINANDNELCINVNSVHLELGTPSYIVATDCKGERQQWKIKPERI